MAKILYITAHPGKVEYSKSLQVGEQFLKAYHEIHPMDEVTYLDLYQLDAPDVDSIVYSAFGKLMGGIEFNDLLPDEQKALLKRQAVIDQFIAHDKYVLVAPMWEFSFPAVLKKYLDIICAVRQTFKYSEFGLPIGLLKNKKAVFIQASGGQNYIPELAEKNKQAMLEANADPELLKNFELFGNFGEPIVKATFALMGVHDYKHILVHSQAIPPVAGGVLEEKLSEAELIARQW